MLKLLSPCGHLTLKVEEARCHRSTQGSVQLEEVTGVPLAGSSLREGQYTTQRDILFYLFMSFFQVTHTLTMYLSLTSGIIPYSISLSLFQSILVFSH